MSTHVVVENGKVTGWIRMADIYRFEGYTFEWHYWCGPVLCRKNGDPYKRQPGEKNPFWGMIDRWRRLPKAKREATRV